MGRKKHSPATATVEPIQAPQASEDPNAYASTFSEPPASAKAYLMEVAASTKVCLDVINAWTVAKPALPALEAAEMLLDVLTPGSDEHGKVLAFVMQVATFNGLDSKDRVKAAKILAVLGL